MHPFFIKPIDDIKTYLTLGLFGVTTYYLGRYIIQRHGFRIANKGADLYLSVREKIRDLRYDCHDHHLHHTLEKDHVVKISNIHFRWQNSDQCIKKECFRINQTIGQDGDYSFDLKSLGLDLEKFRMNDTKLDSEYSGTSSSESQHGTECCLDTFTRNDTEFDNSGCYVLLDIFYEYNGKDYLMTTPFEPSNMTIDLNPGISVTPIEFEDIYFYDESGEILLENEIKNRLLQRINEYLGPRGDFHNSQTTVNLEQLYFPELKNHITKMVLETSLAETLEVSRHENINLDNLI